MSRINIIKITLLCTILITVSPISSVLSTVQQIPIIPIEEKKEKYTPVTYGEWNYYLLPPGTKYEDIEYWGTSTNQVYYTFVDDNIFDYDSISPSTLIRGNMIPQFFEEELLENTSRDTSHVFFDPEPYPRVVRIASDMNPVFNQTLIKPLSLHMDYSSTFFAEADITYWGYVNTSDPFYLDVAFSATDVEADLIFDFAYPTTGYIAGIEYTGENRMTYPFFPMNEGIQVFTLTPNASTLVTLAPHPWDFPDWIPTLTPGSLITGELNQGEPWYKDEVTDQLLKPDNEMFSIRMFNVSLTKDKYYRINAIFDMEDIKPGVPSNEPVRFLVGEHYEIILGEIDQDGMVIRARESEIVTLVLYSPGEANGEYSIFYQEIPPALAMETSPLILNTNITLEYNIYYTFTFDAPRMMAINWTSSTDSFDLTFYIQGAFPDVWIPVTNENFFLPEYGNLYGDSLGDIATNHLGGTNYNWRYMPAGTYAVELDDRDQFDREIRFTAIPIQQPGALTVNQDSIFAIELPMTQNRLNWVNMSTDDHTYPIQSIEYEWTFVGQYNEQIAAATNGNWFGNSNETIANPGVWEAYDYNDTIINALLPTRDYEVPIMILRPYRGWNDTALDYMYTFSSSLTVSANAAADQSAYDLDDLGVSDFVSTITPDYLYYSDPQYFIPWSAISTSTFIDVNEDYTPSREQLYGIPLSLTQYSIYNITVYLHGNNSLTDRNASFHNWYVHLHGGNLQDLEIFNSQVNRAYVTNTSVSMLILTVSDTSYLYVDLRRDYLSPGVYANATMEIIITKLSTTNLEFQLEFEYDPTVRELEVLAEDLIVNEIIPPEMLTESKAAEFPFELLLIVGGVVVGGAAIAAAVVYIRKKRSYV